MRDIAMSDPDEEDVFSGSFLILVYRRDKYYRRTTSFIPSILSSEPDHRTPG